MSTGGAEVHEASAFPKKGSGGQPAHGTGLGTYLGIADDLTAFVDAERHCVSTSQRAQFLDLPVFPAERACLIRIRETQLKNHRIVVGGGSRRETDHFA